MDKWREHTPEAIHNMLQQLYNDLQEVVTSIHFTKIKKTVLQNPFDLNQG